MDAPAAPVATRLPPRIAAFLASLQEAGFGGDIGADLASRLVSATDNSIYQVMPAAVVYPRTGADLNLLVRLAASGPFAPIELSPRGGGTGTNGQSLTQGVVVDVSRHMNRILAFDPDAMMVTVEPGVVLDQLNAFLAPHGLFFPPNVSTATRATIGGMVATDASGKGSRLYGKTSDYIDVMDVVLSDGSDFRVAPMSREDVSVQQRIGGVAGQACAQAYQTVTEHRAEIDAIFPKMNRGLTGYNLQQALDMRGGLSLHRILAGSEGTLAITKAVQLRVMAKPRRRALTVIRYDRFDAALSDVQRLLKSAPLAIEVLDDRVIGVARGDIVWTGLESLLGAASAPVEGLSFVEFVGDDDEAVERQIEALAQVLKADRVSGVVDWRTVRDDGIIAQLWTLREKSVGLMGKLPGRRQGTAFVEDVAVPPEHLPAFVREFRAILDGHGLVYGMYGHADVGCLHVRPALDMKDPADAALIRPISDDVAALSKRYGGLLWGEHGRGYRGEYSPFFFGPTLYAELCKIKTAFDPLNIFNPGKLASASGGAPVQAIDAVSLRGEFDRAVTPAAGDGYERALACNGNGVCFSWDANEAMCPSYKASRDRVQSPKGRATLLREWARRRALSEAGDRTGLEEIELAAKASLDTCLSCKACANQCPVQVDIPSMRSRFLKHFYATRRRPLRDHVVATLEAVLPAAMAAPRLANAILRLGAGPMRALGLVDLPSFSSQQRRLGPLDLVALGAMSPLAKQKSVIFVPDTFTSAFDAAAPVAAQALLKRLGYAVYVAPLHANGKPLHVLGFLDRFERTAHRAVARRMAYEATGIAVVGMDAAVLLLDRAEYRGVVRDGTASRLQSLDEFLAAELAAGRLVAPPSTADSSYDLLIHCTEKTALPAVGERWSQVFSAFGLKAQPKRTGCCGMAGLFGHEREHAAMSRALFDMSWRSHVEGAQPERLMATGFSCRCQTERMTGVRPRHPVEVLLDALA
jgi:FAD/FMN-containing dehydrogenase/Fe-S oxidoreductase